MHKIVPAAVNGSARESLEMPGLGMYSEICFFVFCTFGVDRGDFEDLFFWGSILRGEILRICFFFFVL